MMAIVRAKERKTLWESLSLIVGGSAGLIEHLAHYGFTWEVELACHGLGGLIAIIVEFMVGIQTRASRIKRA